MAQIDKPNLHFNTKLYTGNAGTNAITGVGFQPDLIWGKDRGGDRHWWADAVRGKNGTWQNSGDPTSGSTGTGAISISATTTNGYYMFASGTRHNDSLQASWNFGNGYFGATAVASAQNPDDGVGIFEYDVPAGYRALCTKSLNAQEYS